MIRKKNVVLIGITWLLCLFSYLSLATSDSKTSHRDEIGLTVETLAGLTRLEIWNEHTIRVLHTPTQKLPKNSSMTVIAKPCKVKWQPQDNEDYVMLRTAKFQAHVDKATGRVCFMEGNGEIILAEAVNGTSFESAKFAGAATYCVKQQFEFDPQEALYGLGQHQQGVMNYVGTNVHLQQKNMEVAVPMLLSSKGYAVLWDNPAVTNVNLGAGPKKIIPSACLYNEEGKAGGLTARYYRGENFEELIDTRIDSQVNFDWSQTPPLDVPHDHYSVRWTGFIETEDAGEYTIFASTDDGVRVWIDDKQVINNWTTHAVQTFQAKFNFAAKSKHGICVEFFQGSGDAVAYLEWQMPVKKPAVVWSSEVGNAVDYYFMYGPAPDKVISAYRQLTGTVPMFAKWTWGFWQCKERYQNQKELLDILAEYHKRNIPLDGIIQDWQYWQTGQWGSHEFDSRRYPDPAGMVKTVHDANAHIIVSVWPRFDLETTHLAELEKAGAIYPPVYDNVYPKGQGKWYDPFNSAGRRLYWKQMNKKLGKLDFDGWWLDACEAELGGKWGQMRDLKTDAGPGAAVYNAYPLMHTSAVYQGQRADIPQKRVFILARSAFVGQQRNAAVTWSGDIQGTWDVFAAQIPAGLNFSVSGIPYWNTDIGGFFGGDPADPIYAELFTRWFQFGTFCPMFRVHGTGKGKEMWRFDETTKKILINYDQLRYHLLPYIYSVAWQVTSQDYTMMRPLVMDFQNDRQVYKIADQYMFGPAIMVCPVIKPGVSNRSVYLPAGSFWYDFWTGKSYIGGQTIDTTAPIETLPLFIRAGSIIPYGPMVQYAGEKPADPIELRIYPGADGQFTLYEDQGDNYNYEKGVYAETPICWDETSRQLTIGERKGKFPDMVKERIFRIVLVSPLTGIGIKPTEKVNAEVHYTGQPAKIKL
ncbi:MAG: TIM-barrel domain-containing protein [Sedimentisphaerales bacterium]